MLVSLWKRSCVKVGSTRCALSARSAARLSWLSIEGGSARATWGCTVRVCELILWRALGGSVTSWALMIVRLAWSTTAACTTARLSRLTTVGRSTRAPRGGTAGALHLRWPFASGCVVRCSWSVWTMSSSWGCPGPDGAETPTGSVSAIPHVDMQGHVL